MMHHGGKAGWRAQAWGVSLALGLFACADESAPEGDEGSAEGDLAAAGAVEVDPIQRERFREPTFRTLVEFEGGFDPERGGFFLDLLEPGTLELRAEALPEVNADSEFHTVAMPQWCAASIAQTGDADTVRIRTLPGTIDSSSPGDDLPDACEIPFVDWPEYFATGMLCATQRVQNHYDQTLANVHATLLSFTGDLSTNGPYLRPFGNAVASPPGRNAPSDGIGLWSYGDLDADDFADVIWHFRNVNETTFFFTGAVVFESPEICDDPEGADEDCDGRVNNGCGSYAFGAPCLDDIDCATGNCTEANVCGVSTCDNGVLDGLESDVDCGGLCDGCVAGDACNVDGDCETGFCLASDTCAAGARPAVNQIVISEFLANPGPSLGGPTDNEFVEFYNRGAQPVDLQGCVLRDDDGDAHTIASSAIIPAGGYAHFASTTGAPGWLALGAPAAYAYSGFVLANTGDEIVLECDGVEIDRVDFGPTAVVAGVSFQRSLATIGMGAGEFCVSTEEFLPGSGLGLAMTPGAANTVCPDTNLTCRLAHPGASVAVSPSSPVEAHVRVYANGVTTLSPISNEPSLPYQIQVGYQVGAATDPVANPGAWTWVDASPTPGYAARNAPSSDDYGWDGYRGVFTSPAGAGALSVLGRISADGGTTWMYCDRVVGSSDGSSDGLQLANAGELTVAGGTVGVPAGAGSVVFSEIQGNPVNGVDDLAGEWIELHNPTALPLDLRGCILRDYTGAGAANPTSTPHTFDTSFVVPAGGWAVVANNTLPLTNGNVDVDAWFRGNGGIQLGNSGDRIELECDGVLIAEQEIPASMIGAAVEGRTMQFQQGASVADLGNRDFWCNTQDDVSTRYSAGGGAEGYGSPRAANFASCSGTGGVRFGTSASAPATTSLPLALAGSTHVVAAEFQLAGLTDPVGLNFSYNHRVQIGYAPAGTPAGDPAWTWVDAAPSEDLSAGITGRDIYTAPVAAPAAGGDVHDLRGRWSNTGGRTWSSPSPVWLHLEAEAPAAAPDPCLLFSEYIEGSGHNKALELWNCGASDIDLSDYKICVVQQGISSTKTSCDDFAALSGTLAAGDVWVVANNSAIASIRNAADSTTNTANIVSFNGNDARVLVASSFSGSTPGAGDIIDQIGYVGWPSGNTGLADLTFRRTNCNPNTNPAAWSATDTMVTLPQDTWGTSALTGDDELGVPPDFSCGGAPVGDAGVVIPAAGDLIITEVMANTNLASRRYVEVHNPTASDVSVAGALLRDRTGFEYDVFVIPSNAAPIPAGGYAVFAGSDAALPGTPLARWNLSVFSFDLTAVDSVEIHMGGALVASQAWDASIWPWTFNASMELSEDELGGDTTDPDNWCDGEDVFSTDYLGSPGAANDVCPPPAPPAGARAPLAGDILFTEWMPDPAESGTDTIYEWFEVYNASTDPIELQGTLIEDNAGSFVVSSSFIVPPGEYAVFASTAAAFGVSSPPVTTVVPSRLYIYDTAFLLGNSGDELTLWTNASRTTEVDFISFSPLSPLEGRTAALRTDFLNADFGTRRTNAAAWCRTDASDPAYTYRYDSTVLNNGGRNQGTPGSANVQCD